ncbi:MAG: hypothetical protein ACJA2W_002939 [Planctomycetota bacterium]|jgi:hypothetical protein
MALLTTLGTALLLASPVAPAPQELEDPGPWKPGPELELRLLEQYGNFHVAVVGEELISRIDVFAWLSGPRFDDPTVDQPDLKPEMRQKMQTSAALTQLIEQRLKIQGGRSQGYEEELIEAERERYFRAKLDEMGGAQSAAALFEGMGITPQEYKDLLGEGLLANLWERSITGNTPGATGRVFVDSFIRPGIQFARYREYNESRDPKVNAVVGRNRQGRVSIQRIVLMVTPGGKPAESVRTEIETLRQRIQDEVLTFDEAINTFVAPELRGKESLVEDVPTERLAELFQRDFTTQIDEVKAFVADAPAGDLSSVLEFNSAGVPQAYVLLKIVDRSKATEALPFDTLELQVKLRQAVAEEASEVRVARGLAELVRTTHLAPDDLRRQFLSAGRRLRSR